MSVAQNLAYSVVQVAHNLGAVATAGGSLAAAAVKESAPQRKLVWVALAGWGAQAATGVLFGAVSYYFYHRFPDISGVAIDALTIKMTCTVLGSALLVYYLMRGEDWTGDKRNGVCVASTALAVMALSAAAFLRWFA